MPTRTIDRQWKSQIGQQTGSGSTYAEGGGDISYAVGQVAFIRYYIDVPKNTTINSATITFNQVVKNDSNQNSFHTIRAHGADDSTVLRPGTNEWARVTTATTASVAWNPTWVGGAPSNDTSVAITSIVQELVNRTNWKAGSFITITIECTNENGSDMGFRANNDFIFSPYLTLNYTLPVTTTKSDVNYVINPTFDSTLDGLDGGNAVPGWQQNQHYGYFVDSANQGTMVRDNGFIRVPGVPSMKFTTGTPPSPNDKRTGPYTQPQVIVGEQNVFCGWLFIPSYVTSTVQAEAVYFGGQTATTITQRDTWVPFCTTPYDFTGETNAYKYYTLSIIGPYQAGWNIWLSEPCVTKSIIKQMPFSGATSKANITHRNTLSKQGGSREYVSKRFVHDGTSAKPASTYGLNEYGLYYLNNNN